MIGEHASGSAHGGWYLEDPSIYTTEWSSDDCSWSWRFEEDDSTSITVQANGDAVTVASACGEWKATSDTLSSGPVADEHDWELEVDADGDGSAPPYDCDDTDASVYPCASDTWYDGVDSDCDGASDGDADGDGHDAVVYGGDDCDDETASIPAASEIMCDDIDQDCDGEDTCPEVDTGVPPPSKRPARSSGGTGSCGGAGSSGGAGAIVVPLLLLAHRRR